MPPWADVVVAGAMVEQLELGMSSGRCLLVLALYRKSMYSHRQDKVIYTKSKWKDEADLKLDHHRVSTVEGFICSQITQTEEKQDGGK